MKKKPKDREHERPDVLPSEQLHYMIDAHLVNLLTWAHRSAGMCAGMRFSHYGYKRMEVEANRRRITYMVIRAGRSGVKLEEVSRVLAGDLLPPRRRLAQDAIRRAAVLCEAARQFGRPSDPATPEMFATYLDFLKRGTTLWAHFAGQSKERLLDMHRGSVDVPAAVAQLFEWADDDTLVSGDPILRAATLYWGLSILYPYDYERPAIDAIVDHELRAGSIDRHGLLVLPDYELGESALRLGGIITSAADHRGDLSRYFEHFILDFARVLVEHHKRLEAFQDREDRLPWLMVRPPDELDRQVFDIIERFGSARTQDILGELSDPPPLRTLQRRLQRLCKDRVDHQEWGPKVRLLSTRRACLNAITAAMRHDMAYEMSAYRFVVSCNCTSFTGSLLTIGSLMLASRFEPNFICANQSTVWFTGSPTGHPDGASVFFGQSSRGFAGIAVGDRRCSGSRRSA